MPIGGVPNLCGRSRREPRLGVCPANNAIALLAVLGGCNQIASQIVVNEATSVAATYALAPFLSAGGNIGASSTNSVGLQNAVAIASALVSVSRE